MTAEIIEQENLDEGTTDLPVSDALTQDQLVTELSPPDTTTDPTPAPEALPDKYQGKSIQEVVSMHQQAEKLIGKHSSEVGELRSMVDGYIKTNLEADNPPAEPEVDFFEDPQAAVSQAIDKHPAVREAKQAATQHRHAAALTTLQAKHPDMNKVLENPSFTEWVQGSPVRTELFERADKNYLVQVYSKLTLGATRKEEVKVVEITVTLS
jgi:hypothetical protein